MTKFDLAAQQKLDLHLPANAFGAGYVGLTEGVALALEDGFDPSIRMGQRFIAIDRNSGAFYHPQNGVVAMIYRAVVHDVALEGRKPFSTLRRSTEEKISTSLIKVDASLPNGIKVKTVKGDGSKDYVLRVWSGIRTTGRPVLAFDGEALVELSVGDQLTIFFEDGFVRQYEQDKDGLVEVELSPAMMATLRIDDARLRLATVTPEQWPDPERREGQLRFILGGMVDLFHLAAKDEVIRKDLAQFFFNLEQSLLGLIHRKLVAVLHQRDPLLAHAFSAPANGETVVPMKPRVTDPEAANKRAVIAARRQARRDELNKVSQGMKGTSSGGGGKQQKGGGKKGK